MVVPICIHLGKIQEVRMATALNPQQIVSLYITVYHKAIIEIVGNLLNNFRGKYLNPMRPNPLSNKISIHQAFLLLVQNVFRYRAWKTP